MSSKSDCRRNQLSQPSQTDDYSNSRLNYLMASLPAVIYTCEVKGDFAATFISNTVYQQLGYAPETFTKNPKFWIENIHPDDRIRVFKDLDALFDNDYHCHEYRFKHSEGHYCWMRDEVKLIRDEKGNPIEAVGSWIDISDLKHKEEALRKSEEKFRGISETTKDAIVLINEKGLISYWNKSAEQIFGHTPEEAIGQPLDYFIGNAGITEFHNQAIPIFSKTVTNKASHKLLELPAKRKCGIEFAAEFSINILKLGESWQAMVVISDVSQQKTAEEEMLAINAKQKKLIETLTETKEQLLQSEKLAAIGQLSAGVAHEINNPVGFVGSNINAMRGYAEQLLAIIDDIESQTSSMQNPTCSMEVIAAVKEKFEFDYIAEDLSDLFTETQEGIARIQKIVADLKGFARASDGEWEQVDLHKEIEATINVVWNELKYHCTIEKEFGELPPVSCLRSEINQVILNLLVNASHAIKDRGTITIRTSADEANIWLQVEDTGKGIDPKILSKIFDPFFTTKPIGKGTGLGLSVSYGIIEKHGGTLEVSSEVGEGSIFTITIPRCRPEE